MKLFLPDSRLGPETFADLHVPEDAEAADLLVYLGGAVSVREYAARSETPPTDVLSLLASAPRPVPALIISYPPALPGRPEAAAKAFLEHFREELLPRLPRRPERLSVVGYSLGAALAVLLARGEAPRVVALATVGAVGAAEAAAYAGPGLGPLSCSVLVAWNTGDPCVPHSERFAAELEAKGARFEVRRGEGGHAFEEYIRNGVMRAAVEAALLGCDSHESG